MKKKGLFISFEGTEGSGKSTQIKKLSQLLKKQNIATTVSKEPGGTPTGLKLRQMILDTNTSFKHPKTELLLFIADRMEHCEAVLKPSLAKGELVLCDRYMDSTEAYQIGGRKMPASFVHQLHKHIDLIPDLTLIFDLPVDEGLRRAKSRAALDRFEQESLVFHNRIRRRYRAIAKRDNQRCILLEVGGLNEEAVFDTVLAAIKKRFPRLL